MGLFSRRTLAVFAVVGLTTGLSLSAIVWFGLYNVAADDPHTRPFYWLLENVRDRSIASRAGDVEVPDDLDARARIVQGAGNYAAMCAGCHLAPGSGPTELSTGLYPAPPDLTAARIDAARAFWVAKHGIKASGMPAWGRSMDDTYLWNLVGFLQVLPTLDAAGYHALVAASEGHSHGGRETGGGERPAHDDGHAADDHAHAHAPAPEPAPETTHRHDTDSPHEAPHDHH